MYTPVRHIIHRLLLTAARATTQSLLKVTAFARQNNCVWHYLVIWDYQCFQSASPDLTTRRTCLHCDPLDCINSFALHHHVRPRKRKRKETKGSKNYNVCRYTQRLHGCSHSSERLSPCRKRVTCHRAVSEL